jgi:hypothetical protein
MTNVLKIMQETETTHQNPSHTATDQVQADSSLIFPQVLVPQGEAISDHV